MNGYDVDRYGIPKPPRSMLGRELAPEEGVFQSRIWVYLTDALISTAFILVLYLVGYFAGKVGLATSQLVTLLVDCFILLTAAAWIMGESKVKIYHRNMAEYRAAMDAMKKKNE